MISKSHYMISKPQHTISKPSGLTYIPDAITEDEEIALINFIDSKEWSTNLKRKVQQYGYAYSYKTSRVALDQKVPEIPEMFQTLIDRFNLDDPNQIIVNNYEVGQGIANHIDSNIFDKQVATLSLNSDVVMDFIRNTTHYPILLERRSLAILEGEARTAFTHGISARKSDYIDNKLKKRSRRISITFRKYKS
jgi:alkylated DNA repair dioxygenase AlkB